MSKIEVQLNKSLQKLEALQQELAETQKKFASLQQRIPEAVTEHNVNRLIRDLKQGKVLLVHPETKAPVKINWLKDAQVDDEGDLIDDFFHRMNQEALGNKFGWK